MKYQKWLAVVIICLLSFTSCQKHPAVGKQYGSNYDIKPLSGAPHHHVELQGVELDYDWHIDQQKKKIELDGVVQITQGDFLIYDLQSLTVTAFLVDSNRVILDSRPFNAFTYGQLSGDAIPFRTSIPYKPEYHYIYFGNVKARGSR